MRELLQGLIRRPHDADQRPADPVPTCVRFDPDKLHPSWLPGAGFELRLGEGPGTPISLDGLREHIVAARTMHGDKEADRLQQELDGLLAIKTRFEANEQRRRSASCDDLA